VFTIILILVGVGTALYTLTVSLELLLEGHLGSVMERRRMDKRIGTLHGHVIVCGWGRVGRAIARELAAAEQGLVGVDNDPGPDRGTIGPHSVTWPGDASDDEVLRRAGIERAAALVAQCRLMPPTCSSR
jgi:voltage-gated potassium channel